MTGHSTAKGSEPAVGSESLSALEASVAPLSLGGAFARMYFRNRLQLFFSLVFPLLFLSMFGAIGLLAQADPSVEVLGPVPSAAREALISEGISVEQSPTAEDAIENLTGGVALAVLDFDEGVAWIPENIGNTPIRAVIDSESLAVVEVPESEIFDFFRFGLPGVLTFSTLNVAFFGTTATLIEMRKLGALNLLRRTPAGALKVILSPLPSKLAGFFLVLTFMIVTSWALGYIPLTAVPGALAVGLLSFGTSITWAYLLGARGTNVEISTAATGGLLPVALMLSGALIPLEILPAIFERAAAFSPIAHVASLYRFAVAGSDPTWAIELSISFLVLSAVAAVALSIRIFRWK